MEREDKLEEEECTGDGDSDYNECNIDYWSGSGKKEGVSNRYAKGWCRRCVTITVLNRIINGRVRRRVRWKERRDTANLCASAERGSHGSMAVHARRFHHPAIYVDHSPSYNCRRPIKHDYLPTGPWNNVQEDEEVEYVGNNMGK